MKNSFNNKTKKEIIVICTVILLLLLVFVCFILYNVSVSECYIGNYDEYICYNGEVYYKICEENKALFSKETLIHYDESIIINYDDLEKRTSIIKGINIKTRFFTEKVRIVYDNETHDNIVFLTLDHFLDTCDYIKINE